MATERGGLVGRASNRKKATNALIRAVVYDGIGLDHPPVSTLLEVLTPVAEAELAYGEAADAARSAGKLNWDKDVPKFPNRTDRCSCSARAR